MRNAKHPLLAAAVLALFAAAAGSSQVAVATTNDSPPGQSAADFAARQTHAPLALVASAVIDFPITDAAGSSWSLNKPFITADGFVAWGWVREEGDYDLDAAMPVCWFDDAGRPLAAVDVDGDTVPDELLPLPDGQLVAVHRKGGDDQSHMRLTRLRRVGDVAEIVDVTEMPSVYGSTPTVTPDAHVLVRPLMQPALLVLTDFTATPIKPRTIPLETAHEANLFGYWTILSPTGDGTRHLLAQRTIGSGRVSMTELRRYTLTDGGLADAKPLRVYPSAHVVGVDAARNRAYVLWYDTQIDPNPPEMGPLAQTLPLNRIDTLDLAAGVALQSSPMEAPIASDWSEFSTQPLSVAFAGRLAITTTDNRIAVIDPAGYVHSITEALPEAIDHFNATPDGSRLLAQSRAVYDEESFSELVPERIHIFSDGSVSPPVVMLEPALRLVGPLTYESAGSWKLHKTLALDGTFIASVSPAGNSNGAGQISSFSFDGSINGWPIGAAVDPRESVFLAPLGPTSFAVLYDHVASGATEDQEADIRPAFAVVTRGDRAENASYPWRVAVSAYLHRKFVRPGRVNRPGALGLWMDQIGPEGEPPTLELYDFGAAIESEQGELKVLREVSFPEGIRSHLGAHVGADGMLHWIGEQPSPDDASLTRYIAFSTPLEGNGLEGDAPASQRVLAELPRPHVALFDYMANQLITLTHAYDGEASVFVNPAGMQFPNLNRLTRIDASTGTVGAAIALPQPLTVIFSSNSDVFANRLVVGSVEGLHVLDANTGRELGRTGELGRGVTSATISTDGRTLLVLLTPDFSRDGDIIANEELLVFELP